MNPFDLFFTKQCPICYIAQEDNDICFKCFSSLSFLGLACQKCQQPFAFHIPGVNICNDCQEGKDFFGQMSCPLIYNELASNLIVRFKNHQDFVLADLFAKLIFNKAKDLLHEDTIIVPVPLYKKRLIWRGYNQSMILAKAIAKLAKVQTFHILERIKDTNSQATKTIQERNDNVKDAFIITEKYKDLNYSHVIIVDDVITTGATVYECAKIFRDVGINVDIVAIARRLRKLL